MRLFGARSRADADRDQSSARMTAAFLESERALADIDTAVGAAQQLNPRSGLRAGWTSLRERYAEVTEEYLRLVSIPDNTAVRPPQAQEYLRCTDDLTAITAEMGRFASDHDPELTRARHALHQAAVLENQARMAATDATTALAQAPADLGGLAAVGRAAQALSAARATFDNATGLIAQRSAATALVAAADQVRTVLGDAPGFAARADTVIRSVDTRRSALLNRSGQVPDMLSALRREFSAECSADLLGVESRIAAHLDAGDGHLRQARASRTTAPDQAITAAEAAREELDAAEDALDGVADRLRTLREVRADPAAVENRVRFRLRDAQLLAVNSSLVDEWGSVLDAQADRISRSRAALDRVHPDYWSYLTQLRAVDQRIGEIIDRMRGQVAAR